MLSVQVEGLTQERGALEAQLGSAESRLAALQEQRDAEAAKAAALQEKLARALAEADSLRTKLPALEERLREEREVWRRPPPCGMCLRVSSPDLCACMSGVAAVAAAAAAMRHVPTRVQP